MGGHVGFNRRVREMRASCGPPPGDAGSPSIVLSSVLLTGVRPVSILNSSGCIGRLEAVNC